MNDSQIENTNEELNNLRTKNSYIHVSRKNNQQQ